MLLNRAYEGAFRHRADHRHDAFPLGKQHEGGDVPDLQLRHRLGVLVRAQLQNLELALSTSVFSDDLVYDRSYHATRTAPTAPTAKRTTETQAVLAVSS